MNAVFNLRLRRYNVTLLLDTWFVYFQIIDPEIPLKSEINIGNRVANAALFFIHVASWKHQKSSSSSIFKYQVCAVKEPERERKREKCGERKSRSFFKDKLDS